jgi:hypothetical protein
MRTRGIRRVYNFPRESFLAPPQVLERIVSAEDLPTTATRTLEFVTGRDGWFDGFACFIRLTVSPSNEVDALPGNTNWDVPYLKLLEDPLPIRQGDIITADFEEELGGPAPHYELRTSVRRGCAILHEDHLDWHGI